MTPTFPWLALLIFLPLVGALLCLLRRDEPQEARALALTTALAVLAIAGWLFVEHGGGASGWLLYEDVAWIERFGIRFTLGLDGFGLVLILLTAFLQVVALLASWTATRHIPFLFALLLAMESGILGVFLALDLILFYVFWELMLIPMFLLINIWGHERRHYAAIKFFLFTLAGSLLMLLGIIALYLIHGAQHGVHTFALAELAGTPLSATQGWWLYLAFLAAFAIKIPLVPFHTWLPDAHTEAPVAGSVDLAGLLLKTGVFGLIRIGFSLFPQQAKESLPALALLALLGLFHASWVAYRQQDTKRLIAYSSVAHLGLVVLGIAAWNATALTGSLFLMLSHGLTTGALFVMVTILHERTGTRRLDQLGGVWARSPVFGGFFLLFALSSLGLPGLANFSGEILVLLGTFMTHPLWAALGMLGVVFAAAYMLRMVQGVLWGAPRHERPWRDLTLREWLLIAPLAVMVVWLGLYPQTFLTPLAEPVRLILAGKGGLP